jgi:hypothetical protein
VKQNDVLLSPAEYRKREFWECCNSREELYLHIKTFLNIDLPRYNVDELSTSNPLDFMWSIYRSMLTNEGDFRHVVACSRNSMKTLCSAILHFYAMLHFRRDCCQLAATRTQSQACIKYLDKFLMIPEVENYADINNKEEKILNNLPNNSFTDKKDCKIVVMVATLKGTNSARASFLISDECELIDPDIMSEAANVADPTMRESFEPISVYLSSRKFAGGPLQELIDQCEDPTKKEGAFLHKWSVADFMQKCPTIKHQPEKPRIAALLHRDTLEVIWGETATEIENKSTYIEILAYHGCRTCGAFIACQARSVKQIGTSPSLRTANFVAGRLRDVKDTKKIISQILNWKPESSGLVFPMFAPSLHVKESKAAYRWITRGVDFNPMNLTEEAYNKCLNSDDPSDLKLVTPSKRDLYKILKQHNWKINWGIDWGYTDPAALVIIAYNRRESRAFVLHSELKTGYSNQNWAEYCATNYGTAFAPDLVCPDMADAAAPTYFAKHYLPTRDTKPSRIETGVSQIRSLLWNVSTQEVNFCILDDRLSADMVEEFQKWTHERTQTGYNFDKYDKDSWNHTCFTRGSVLTKNGPKEISEIEPGEEVLTHKGVFKKVNAIMKRKYTGEILKISPYGREDIFCTPDHPFFLPSPVCDVNELVLLSAHRLQVDNHDLIQFENSKCLIKIQNIEKIDFDGYVYNLEVKEDHSYILNGIAVSNCDAARYCLDPFISEAEIHFAAQNRKETTTEDLYEATKKDPNNLDMQIALAKKQMSDHFLREHGIADLTPKFNIPFAVPLAQASASFLLNKEHIEAGKEGKRKGGIFFRFG